jgi:hypothetical protein
MPRRRIIFIEELVESISAEQADGALAFYLALGKRSIVTSA